MLREQLTILKFTTCASHGALVPVVDGVALCTIGIGAPHLPRYLHSALKDRNPEQRVWHSGIADNYGAPHGRHRVEIYVMEGSPARAIVIHQPNFRQALRLPDEYSKKSRTYYGN